MDEEDPQRGFVLSMLLGPVLKHSFGLPIDEYENGYFACGMLLTDKEKESAQIYNKLAWIIYEKASEEKWNKKQINAALDECCPDEISRNKVLSRIGEIIKGAKAEAVQPTGRVVVRIIETPDPSEP